MAEFPALPLFTDAFIGDTTHLTAAQTGGYLMLLMIAWRLPACALPDDDQKLARWARMDLRAWKVNKDIIMSFWVLGNDNLWRQGRLTDERTYADHKSKESRHAAHARWRKNKDSDDANALRTDMRNACPLPTPTPISKKERKNSSSGARFALQDPPADWIQFCQTQRPDLNPGQTFDSFRDYWIAKPGQAGTKLDWFATWRNWVRNQKGQNYERPKSKHQTIVEAFQRVAAEREQRNSERD